MTGSRFRPEGFQGALDRHLLPIQEELVKALARAQKGFKWESLRLGRAGIQDLASVLVDFAEDLHGQVGLWHALEQHQVGFYGTPLPFAPIPDAGLAAHPIAEARIRHLLWVLYPRLKPDLLLSPDHVDLIPLARTAAEVLRKQFAGLPKDSGVKHLLESSNDQAWQVKRKLVWLGIQSYLFRLFFREYVQEKKTQQLDISVMDDFICEQCTEWSGLGPLEILADVLNLPPARRTDLLSWSERHTAPFKVLSSNREVLTVRNVVNDADYRVRIDMKPNPFRRRNLVMGSLIPWDGEWAWSGEQQRYPSLDRSQIDELREGYGRIPRIAYRYRKGDLEKARGFIREQHQAFVARHGKEWVVFPDSQAMVTDWQEEARRKFESLSKDKQEQFLKKYGSREPRITIPPGLRAEKDGIAVFFNPEEGQEILPDCNDLLSGLRRRGVDLKPKEAADIRGWIHSPAISPKFVRAWAEEFGSESIKNAFLLDRRSEDYILDYLLRRFKGVFYRPRYPALAIAK